MLLPRPRVDYNVFLPHVMANVTGDSRPGLPPNVALSYIKNAVIEFAKRTSILRRTDTIRLQDGLQTYPLINAPDEEKVYRLVSVSRNGRPQDASFDDTCVILSCPVGVSPECEEHIVVEYVALPIRKSCNVDEIIYDDWHDAIVDGALIGIHLMPQKPWTSNAASQSRDKNFRIAIGDARKKYHYDRYGTRTPTVPRNHRW